MLLILLTKMNVDASVCLSRHFSGIPLAILAIIEIQKARGCQMFKDTGIPEERKDIKNEWIKNRVVNDSTDSIAGGSRPGIGRT